jgi:HK97 family phage major capsid protein
MEKELKDALVEHKEAIVVMVEELKTAAGDDKTALELQLTEAKTARDTMQTQLDQIATDQKNARLDIQKKDEKHETFEESMGKLLNSDEFKAAKTKGFPAGSNKFEVKVDTSVVTGDVNRTRQNLTIGFAPENQLAFIANMSQMFIDQDKNRVLWVDGAYTSNVGYVSEGTGQATADGGTAVEKYREMSKISAKLPLTTEMLEDENYVASAFRSKMSEKSALFTDGEAYDGDGSDGGEPKHIYGIKGHATAFSAATSGTATSVVDANIGDLVDAMILQAEKANFRTSNVLWMNPSDFFSFKTAKDDNGNYLFVKEVNGQYSIQGLRVIRSNRVTVGDMLLADTSKLQYWTKRRAELKFSQMNGTNFVDDVWTAVMFVRSQVVVETFDKLSLIFVDDIDAAITSITKV